VTDLLKQLLHSYGLLYVTISMLQVNRPGTSHASLSEYYESLGAAEPGEPVLVVRISADGETRFLRQNSEQLPPKLRETYGCGDVTIMELPEDEYYIFQAFRPGIFDLDKQLPSFLLQMALIYGYTLFENYLADVIRIRLRAHPAQVGLKKQITVSDVLDSDSRESLIDKIIEGELYRLMHEPIVTILESLRIRLGLRGLTAEFDKAIGILSMTRNCLIHNGGKVDSKLASMDSALSVSQALDISSVTLSDSINTCRKLCAAIDAALELLNGGVNT